MLKSERSWIQRTFGPIEEGALRTAIFTLVNTAIGTGMLALSQAIARFGLIPGSLMLVVGALNLATGLYCFNMLIHHYPSAMIYSQLAKLTLGKFAEKFVNWVYLIYVWSSLIAYALASKLKSKSIFLQNGQHGPCSFYKYFSRIFG